MTIDTQKTPAYQNSGTEALADLLQEGIDQSREVLAIIEENKTSPKGLDALKARLAFFEEIHPRLLALPKI